jgi:hypothetical protein
VHSEVGAMEKTTADRKRRANDSKQPDLCDGIDEREDVVTTVRPGPPRRTFQLNGTMIPSLTALSTHTGIPIATLSVRLKRGLTVEEAVKPQSHKGHLPLIVEGVSYVSRAAAARAYGLKRNLVTMRLSVHWTLDEALEVVSRERQGEGGVVYRVRHLESGMAYIGITTLMRPLERWEQHVNDAMTDYDRGKNEKSLQHAIRQHGASAFVFEVVAESDTDHGPSRLEVSLIQHYGTKSPAGYNLYRGGGSFRREGHRVTVGVRSLRNLREACRILGKNYVLVHNRLNAKSLGNPSWTVD